MARQCNEAAVRQVLQRQRQRLMAYPTVVGIGMQQEQLPSGTPCFFIQVYVSTHSSPRLIPEMLDDVDVRVQEIGRIIPD